MIARSELVIIFKFWLKFFVFISQNFDFNAKILAFLMSKLSKFSFLLSKFGFLRSEFWFWSQNFDDKVRICHNFQILDKILVFESQNLDHNVKICQNFGFLMSKLSIFFFIVKIWVFKVRILVLKLKFWWQGQNLS